MRERTRLHDRTRNTDHTSSGATSSGQPLEPRLRASLERRFDHNFADVRVHDDAGADALTRASGALALTSGNDVYFRQGEYDPRTNDGLHMLVHELAHTIQQSGGAAKTASGSDASAYEQEAESAASSVLDGGTVSLQPSAAVPCVQRWQAPDAAWWGDTMGNGVMTAANGVASVPIFGNVMSGLNSGLAGGIGVGADLLGYDGIADDAYSLMTHHALNSVPVLGNIRAAKNATEDSVATAGNFMGVDRNTAEEDFVAGGGRGQITSGIRSLWNGFWY
jgi:hypothetical protein